MYRWLFQITLPAVMALLAAACATPDIQSPAPPSAPAKSPAATPPPPPPPVPAGQARGVVFADRNGNGVRDPGEDGIAGVGVSNGREVTRTGSDGLYLLEIADGDNVFVIKPAAYRYPVDEFNRVQFSRHVRGGAVADEGFWIEFSLQPQAVKDNFSISVLADPQVRKPYELDFLQRAIVTELGDRGDFAFGITLGDIVYSRLHLFDAVASVIAQAGVPWYYVVGNHDLDHDALNHADAQRSYVEHFGPVNYAFNEGLVHFVVLNSMSLNGHRAGSPRYRGGLDSGQLEFLANDLRQVPKDRLVVVATHYPINFFDKEAAHEAGWLELLRMLADFPHTLSLSGHTHVQSLWHLGAGEGWPGRGEHLHYNVGTASGSWWRGPRDSDGIPDATMSDGTPNGYAIIHFEGTDFELEYKAARMPADYRMALTHVAGDGNAPAKLYANVFLGSRHTAVEYRLDSGDWTPMQQVIEPDPGYRQRWRSTRNDSASMWDTLPEPKESPHLWQAPMALRPGARLEVRVTEQGRRYSDIVILPRGAGDDGVIVLNQPVRM